MATAVERATCTMLDPPDLLSSTMDVVIMPDFLLKFADWMDWRTLTMLRGTNYGCSVTLPNWQPWHSIGALLYGYQHTKSLAAGLTPLNRLKRWQALLHMLAPTAPPPLQTMLNWWNDLVKRIIDELFIKPFTYADAQSFLAKAISPSIEMNLCEELNTFDWKVNSIMQRPVPAQRQLAVFTSELSLLCLPHPALYKYVSWIVLAWLD